ncbi:hypothetical protein D9757_002613 [Collybiopsis confluens]|uniref:Pre-rRNA-processing protein RIX1 n=1 Tax=Collybiopsis confluens TaxID=2823264 RepID=A0A8H5HWD7_9AGAR|nr:hypothetical protein D9757_002613 [Collybiopsis confluens]
MDTHPLKALLSFHLASDSSAIAHLPDIIDLISAQHFSHSSHTTKWTARINSLLHSKEAGARWAGLCLAHRTSVCSKTLMVECAQSWLGVTIPILSKKESLPVVKASINLSRAVFTNATDIPEFQRQVSTPNVPKFIAALLTFLERDSELELKKVSLMTLTRLVPLYPNIHRTSYPALFAIISRTLAQPVHLDRELVKFTSQLHATLHLTAGKVGAANMWRKSLDESIAFAWTAFTGVRSTCPDEDGRFPQVTLLHEEPTTSVTLSMNRLRTSIRVICELLQSSTQRPVLVPVGSLVKLASKMILVTVHAAAPASCDPVIWTMETVVIPKIWAEACRLIMCLAECLGHHLSPHSSRLLSYFVFHLETRLPANQRISFLDTVLALLRHCHPVDSPVLCSRLTKIVLSELAVVLPSQTEGQASLAETIGPGKGKKNRKRARNYEGDELFKSSANVICPTADEAKAVLLACDMLPILLRNTELSPAVHSMASRVILAMYLGLPQMMPATLSPYAHVYDALLSKIHEAGTLLASGTTSAMSKSLSLVLSAGTNMNVHLGSSHQVDLLIHPRLPPLLRPLPTVDSLTLFRIEESTEEAEVRQSLGIETSPLASAPANPANIFVDEDVQMTTELPAITALPVPKTLISSVQSAPATTPKQHVMLEISSSVLPVVDKSSTMPNLGFSPSASIGKPASLPYPSQTAGASQATSSLVATLSDDDEEIPTINPDSDSDSEE